MNENDRQRYRIKNTGLADALRPNLPHIRVHVMTRPTGRQFSNLGEALRARIKVASTVPYTEK